MTSITLKNAHLPAPPKGKYPAKAHAKKVWQCILDARGGKQSDGREEVIYLESQKTTMIEDDDRAEPFRQRRAFFYMSGCNLPDTCLIYNATNDHLILFIPPVEADKVIWDGLPLTTTQAMEKYDIDECLTIPELASHATFSSAVNIHVIPDRYSLSCLVESNKSSSFSLLSNELEAGSNKARITKDSFEIALLRHANHITGYAHANAMRTVSTALNETEIMGVFVGTAIANGGQQMAYDCICASAPNGAQLHYVKNDEDFYPEEKESGDHHTKHHDHGHTDGHHHKHSTKNGRLNMLIDAGCEYSCYCSDITRTYPISGTWSVESKHIYDLVEKMQSEAMKMIRGGAIWDDLHYKAHEVAVRGLLSLGILKSPSGTSIDTSNDGNEALVKELLDSRVSTLFYPHGLGHYLGLDTHDVGGNANYKDPDPMFKLLRIRGPIPTNSVVTNEPGIYFCRFIVEPAKDHKVWGKMIDWDVVEKYWSIGGVRIEDDIWVKEDGYENLTTAPTTWEEMRKCIMREA